MRKNLLLYTLHIAYFLYILIIEMLYKFIIVRELLLNRSIRVYNKNLKHIRETNFISILFFLECNFAAFNKFLLFALSFLYIFIS